MYDGFSLVLTNTKKIQQTCPAQPDPKINYTFSQKNRHGTEFQLQPHWNESRLSIHLQPREEVTTTTAVAAQTSKRFRLTSRGASVGLPPADRCCASASHGAYGANGDIPALGRRKIHYGREKSRRMSRFLPSVSSAWKCTKSAVCFVSFFNYYLKRCVHLRANEVKKSGWKMKYTPVTWWNWCKK